MVLTASFINTSLKPHRVRASPEETWSVVYTVRSDIKSYLEQYAASIYAHKNDQASSIKQDLHRVFQDMQAKLEKCYLDHQENMKFDKDSMLVQEKIKSLQEEGLTLIGEIQVMASKILLQTLELHEYTIPRLFIVLPKPIGQWDKFTTPFRHQFRLFFLCEGCGCIDSDHPDEIHLAIHPGYDLMRPMEFFEKYSSYVLTLLKTIKYGIKFSGVVVTPLAQFRLLEDLKDVRVGLDLANNTAGFLIEKAIEFLEEKVRLADGCDNSTGMGVPEPLEGVELRQLESFLHSIDEDRAFGNLCRIVTDEGHVKWVCRKYYQRMHGESGRLSMVQLEDHIQKRKGTLDLNLRRAEVKISSRCDAIQFYDILSKTKGLVELSICLDWNAMIEDLAALGRAVSLTEITHLTIDGRKIERRLPSGGRYTSHRFNPILDLLSRRRIRSLTLDGFTDFYFRLKDTCISEYPQLRVLSVDSNVHSTSPKSRFNKFLLSCPNLTKLTLKCCQLPEVFKYFEENAPRFRKLETLTLESHDLSITVSLFDGEMVTVTGTLRSCQRMTSLDLSFLFSCCLTKFTVHWDSSPTVKPIPLEEFMERNSMLEELDIITPLSCYESLLLRIISATWSPELSRILLSNEGIDHKSTLVTVILSPGGDFRDITTDIQMQPSEENEYLWAIFEQYGHTIRRLVTNEQLQDDHLLQLSAAVKRDGSKLTHFVLNTNSLEAPGWNAIHDILGGSPKLEHLHLVFQALHRKDQRDLARDLLDIYGSRITGLSLGGEPVVTWNDGYQEILAMQKKLTGLETFKLTCNTPQQLFHDHARLIAAVLSPPKTSDDARPSVRVLSSVLSPRTTSTFYVAATSSPRDAIYPERGLPGLPPSALPTHITSSPLMNRPPNCGLKVLCLEHVGFEPQGWEVILKALDLTVLESLSFRGTNFDRPELRLLLDRIPDDNGFVPFKDLNLAHTKLAQNEEKDSVNTRHTLMRMLKEKSKYLKISGLE